MGHSRAFSCRATTALSRERLGAIVAMSWVEASVVAAVGLIAAAGPWRFLFLLFLLVPLATGAILIRPLAGAKVLLSDGALIVDWLRPARFRYTFRADQVTRADVVPQPDLSRELAYSCDPTAGLLRLIRGKRPVVNLEFAVPQQVTFQGERRRLWDRPSRVPLGVSTLLLAVDEPAALASALGSRSDAPPGQLPVRPGGDLADGQLVGSRTGLPETHLPEPSQPAPRPVTADAAQALIAAGLSFSYGPVTAVEEAGLELRPGEVVGLVGLNGAGKTTTLQMLAGVLKPQTGRIAVAGSDLWPVARAAVPSPRGGADGPRARPDGSEARSRIGFLPDAFPVYGRLIGWDYLDFVALLHSVPLRLARRRAADLAAALDFDLDVLHRATGGYSTGMKRKLLLIAAAIHAPSFLLLDEPASGLDPAAQVLFRRWLVETAAAGRGILLSSHSLDLIAGQCTRVVVLHRGRVAARGTLAELAAEFGAEPGDPEAVFFAAIGAAGRGRKAGRGASPRPHP